MRTWLPCLLLAVCLAGWAQQPFTYTGKSGVAFTVTGDGLSRITLGGKVVARGGVRFFNPGAQCPTIANGVKVADVANATVEPVDAATVRVRQVQGDVTVTYTYAFADEDVRIKAKVENNAPRDDLPMVGFTGLQFIFAKTPRGILCERPLAQLDARDQWFRGGIIAQCHPSYAVPIGGCYQEDGALGVGGTPLNTGIAQTLIHGLPVQPVDGQFARTLEYLQPRRVPREGAATVEFLLRVSANTDWKHLLAPYKAHFTATYGAVRYRSDNRPLVMHCVASSDYHVTPLNPLGYQGADFTTADGVNRYCDGMIAQMKKANAQGVVLWGLGGWEPRGAMFRTDFDVLPPAVDGQLPLLRKRFEEADMKLGLCTRPGEFTVRGTWGTDWTFLINPDDLQHLEAQVWVRFKRMIDKGFTCYYMDTFGNSYTDVLIMKFLREKMGPQIQTYVEHDCDAMLVFSGVFDYIQWDDKAQQWSIGSPNPIYQWLVPGVGSMIVVNTDDHTLKAHGLPYEYAFAHRVSPTLLGGDRYLPEIRASVEKYLDADGQWKP
jgi:hypothetical protein